MKINKLIKISFFIALLLGFLGSCEPPKKQDNFVKLNLLQVNDVYEIEPIENGKYGGMARMATLKKDLQKANPNTWLVLSGDFINPSVYGTLKFEGKAIKGRQMIEAMNAAKVDFVTFGNHEFDVYENELLSRLNESEFEWIATNAFHKQDSLISPFVKVRNEQEIACPTYKIIDIKAENGKVAKMGMIGLTINSNKKDYVYYKDLKESTQNVCDELKDKCDFIVAITHLTIDEDVNIAGDFPQIALLMGGHEHENHIQRVGQTTIAKADANAKTAYIHRLKYDFETKKLTIDSELKKIDESILDDPETKVVVDKWTTIAETSFKSSGFNTEDIILELDTAIDARDLVTRGRQCAVGKMITSAMADAWEDADLITLGGGSIRVDDYISGNITEYDILRMLPFGGKTMLVEMKGELLIDFLTAGKQNKGSGGYLQLKNATFDEGKKVWLVQGKEVDLKKNYKVVINDYLITGREAGMSFMTKDNPLILKVEMPNSNDSSDVRNDIRRVLINYLKNQTK